VLTQVQAQINEGGQVLLKALVTGDTATLDAVLDSLNSKGSVISREAMHLVRLAMVEIGHAIVEMELKQAGYIVGTVAYEAVETALLVAIEAGLAAATVGTAGAATPATAGGTAAIVSAKGVAVASLVNRLNRIPAITKWPEIVKAVDKFGTFVKWTLNYPMCFVAGTKVHTEDGLKNIEEIHPGDMVLTRDEDAPDSENRYRRVTELFRTNPSRLLTFWGKHLEQTLGVAKPTTPLPNDDVWHAHHILFKSGQVGKQADLVKEGQEILRQVGIDPLFGKEVFVWAPLHAKGQHHTDTADDLVRDLKALWDSGSRSKQKFADILKKHGEIAAGRR
jgi:hypothetical protein